MLAGWTGSAVGCFCYRATFLPSYCASAVRHPNLFLFTGKNTYALQSDVRGWKRAFTQKHGEANLSIEEASTLDWGKFSDEAKAAPFLAEKRLLIVEGIPPVSKEQCDVLLSSMHEQTLLLVIEPELDKRKAMTKFLLQRATVRVFSSLTREQLIPWLLSIGKEHGVTIHPRDAAFLIALVGVDQWHLERECRKVIAYASPDPPKQEHMEKVCLPSGTHAAWTLSDLIGRGKAEEAASYSHALFASGEDAGFLWNAVFLTIVKNLVTLWVTVQEKRLPVPALARETGVHFLSVQSLLPFVQSLSKEQVQHIVRSVLGADYALKTGELRATAGEPIELQTMLERQILALRA